MNNRVTCSCGWSWNKSDSSKKDMYVCHQCGKDNTMKDGGWLSKFEDAPEAQNGIEGTMGGLTDQGFNYNGAWGGTMQEGGYAPKTERKLIKKYVDPVKKRAIERAKKQGINTGAHNGPLDAIRHASSAAATSSILPSWANLVPGVLPLNLAATNIAGLVHEINSPNNWKERSSDLYNNFIGSIAGVLPISEENKHNLLIQAQKYNVLSNLGNTEIMNRKAPVKKKTVAPKPLSPSDIKAFANALQMGGSIPGSVGFTYARTQSPAPSNGPYAKKTKASAQNGQEMKFYQEGLDWKPKSISKNGGWLSKYEGGGIIEDDMGQWAHPGEITKINSNQITMQGVGYPVLGISDTGDTQMMYPDQEYTYDGESVTEYPMAQRGKIVPLRDLMKQEDEKLKAKSDNTKVVPQKTISDKEANALKARKDAEELARRKQAIATSYAARNKPFSAQQLAEETGAIGDKLRIFPNDPNSFIDEYINPGVMIGNMASALGRAPLDIQQGNYGQAALSVATPLALGAGEAFAQPYIKQAGRVISEQPVVQNILGPIQFRTEKNILKNKFSDIVNRYQTNPEAARRLTETLGITPEQLGSPKLQFNPNTGSRYNSTHNYINIDFPEARRLQKLGYDLSDEAILEHEWNHYLQKKAYELSPEYKTLVDEYYNDLDFYNFEKSKVAPLKFQMDNFFSNNPLYKPDYPVATSMPTSVDYDLLNAFGNPELIRQPLTRRGANDLEYFLEGSMTEPMPHLGEMRQNMLERGIIQNKYQPITEENVYQFLSNPNGDRISRFASHKNPETIKALADAFKILPASIPVGVVASTQLPEEKNGGWLNKYK